MAYLGIWTEVILRILARAVHLISVFFMFTVLVLECFFSLEKFSVLYEDSTFKKCQNGAGMAMIGSGIVLAALMRRSDALPTQNKWLAYFPPKFFMSLLLTPISDKLALVLVGHRKLVADDEGERHIFDLS